MFGLALSLQYVNAARFNSSMTFLREEDATKIRRMRRSPSTYAYARTLNRPVWYPTMNMIINLAVGLCIFVFNVYFILTANDPTSAVWNSVALTFIVEIDEVFKPKNGRKRGRVQCLLAELFDGLLPLRGRLLVDSDDEDDYDREEGMTVERRMGPSDRCARRQILRRAVRRHTYE